MVSIQVDLILKLLKPAGVNMGCHCTLLCICLDFSMIKKIEIDELSNFTPMFLSLTSNTENYTAVYILVILYMQ